MKTSKTLDFVAPGETIRTELKLTCPQCGVTSKLIADGYTFKKNDLDMQVGRVRFWIQVIYDDIPPLCACILDGLSGLPIVGLYVDGQHLN